MRGHHPVGDSEKGGIVARPNMLEHAHRNQFVEPASEFAVIHEVDVHWQTGATLPGETGLFPGDGDAGNADTVALDHVTGQPPPAAADVQERFAAAQFQLVADQPELGVLGFFQADRFLPVTAAIEHQGIEHGGVNVVADVVMVFTDLKGPPPGPVQRGRREDQALPPARAPATGRKFWPLRGCCNPPLPLGRVVFGLGSWCHLLSLRLLPILETGQGINIIRTRAASGFDPNTISTTTGF